VIHGFYSHGIAISASSGTATQIFIDDTISSDNQGSGLNINASGNYVYVQVTGSHINNNLDGILSGNHSRTTVVTSEAAGNS